MNIADFVDGLRDATGESQAVVAVFIDVRGFSEFARTVESVDAAIFLRKLYVAVLSEHLPMASFAKTTGDGLMVIIEYAETDVERAVTAAISGSIELITEYPGSVGADPMITFAPPPNIGIGIARGSATRLS